jgi:predicted nucleotidyltransferase
MRLIKKEVTLIKQLVNAFDNRATIYLYGSRVDNLAKGGDIDLLIISPRFSFKDQLKIKSELYSQLGEQRIDVLIVDDLTSAFVQLILDTAILL